jgi:hypothetical protein
MGTTFGCDSEFILTLHGKYKSAVPVLRGTRDKRQRIDGVEIFHDNVLAEVAIEYSNTWHQVRGSFHHALKTLARAVDPCKLNLFASADYPRSELTDPEAKEAGCSEEKDAYTRSTLPSQEDKIKTGAFRTAGAHIHLGGDGVLQNSIRLKLVVYAMDLFVAVPSLFLDDNIFARERRAMYGRAGSYREKPYGLEYRVLGPFWLRSPSTAELFYNLSMFALDFVESGKFDRFWSIDEKKLFDGKKDAYQCHGYNKDLLIDTINTYDMVEAEKFLEFISHFLPAQLVRDFERERESEPDLYTSWDI